MVPCLVEVVKLLVRDVRYLRYVRNLVPTGFIPRVRVRAHICGGTKKVPQVPQRLIMLLFSKGLCVRNLYLSRFRIGSAKRVKVPHFRSLGPDTDFHRDHFVCKSRLLCRH